MLSLVLTAEDRAELEAKVLAAAFKQSFERGDSAGAALAHKSLSSILQARTNNGKAAAANSFGQTERGRQVSSLIDRLHRTAGTADCILVMMEWDPALQESGSASPAAAGGSEPPLQPDTAAACAEQDGAQPGGEMIDRAQQEHSPVAAAQSSPPTPSQAQFVEEHRDSSERSVDAPAPADHGDPPRWQESPESGQPSSGGNLEFPRRTEAGQSDCNAQPAASMLAETELPQATPDREEVPAEDSNRHIWDSNQQAAEQTGRTAAGSEPPDTEGQPAEHPPSADAGEQQIDHAYEDRTEEAAVKPFVQESGMDIQEQLIASHSETVTVSIGNRSNQQEAGNALPTTPRPGVDHPETAFDMSPSLSGMETSDPPAEETPAATQADPAPSVEPPAGGPMDYLDFGDNRAAPAEGTIAYSGSGEQAEAEAADPLQALLASGTPNPLQSVLGGEPSLDGPNFYETLGVHKTSSFEQIHTAFFRLLRRHIQDFSARSGTGRDVKSFRERLRFLCIAHDILKDPVTRTDYDLRALGLRGKAQVETPEDKAGQTNRTRLMIGELLECAKIIETAELQIALDMHKATPEMPFGQFLVKAGFLDQDELDAAIMGQKLISAGKVTVTQFQIAMSLMHQEGVPFFDTLVQEGWILPRDIFDEKSDLFNTAEHEGPRIREIAVNPAAGQPASKVISVNNLGSQMPDWAGQLLWSEEESGDDGQDETEFSGRATQESPPPPAVDTTIGATPESGGESTTTGDSSQTGDQETDTGSEKTVQESGAQQAAGSPESAAEHEASSHAHPAEQTGSPVEGAPERCGGPTDEMSSLNDNTDNADSKTQAQDSEESQAAGKSGKESPGRQSRQGLKKRSR